jgi:hypothetical protein
MIDDLRRVVLVLCHWIIQLIRICTPVSWQKPNYYYNNKYSSHNGKEYYNRQRIKDAVRSANTSAKRYNYITNIFGRWGKLYLLRHWLKNGSIQGYDDEGLYISLQQPSPILRSEDNWRRAMWDWDEPVVVSSSHCKGIHDRLTMVPEQLVSRRSLDRWLKSLGYYGWDGRRSWEWSP